MMMIAPNSFACQKEMAQGKEKEKAGDQRKGGQKGTPMPGAVPPIDPSRSRVSDVRNRRKTWTVELVSTPQEEQRGLGISPILSR